MGSGERTAWTIRRGDVASGGTVAEERGRRNPPVQRLGSRAPGDLATGVTASMHIVKLQAQAGPVWLL